MAIAKQFTALQNFPAEDAIGRKSEYCEGFVYSILEGNDALLQNAEQWALEGKVVIHDVGKGPKPSVPTTTGTLTTGEEPEA